MLGAHFDSRAAATGATDNADRQRRDDGSDADPQSDRREAAAHDPHRAVGRRRAGAARLARLRRASTSPTRRR